MTHNSDCLGALPGCGGGIWYDFWLFALGFPYLSSPCRTISVALEFPHAEVVGVDLAPNTARYACRWSIAKLYKYMRHV